MNQFETILSGYRQVELRWEDTLQRLAARELGDAQKWIDIANMNGLAPPYVTGDPAVASDTVAMYGDVLWVPSTSVMVSSANSPDLIFDQDVMLTNGRLTSDGKDFNLAYGRDNLKQALSNRLGTEKKELLFHQDYGCDISTMIGGLDTGVAGVLAASYVESALRADPRVKDVPACVVTVTGDQIYVEAAVLPIDGRQLQFGGYF